jgi:hypothetical protein
MVSFYVCFVITTFTECFFQSLKLSNELVSYYDIVPCRTTLPKHDLAPLEFLIKGHDNSLVNSRDIQLSMTFFITFRDVTKDEGWKQLSPDIHLVPINGFLHTVV